MNKNKSKTCDKKTDDPNFSISKNRLFVFFLLLTIVFAVLIIAFSATLNKNLINNEENAILSSDWKYSVDGGAFLKTSLPNRISAPPNSKIMLKAMLPSKTIKGETVLLRTSQQDVEVYVVSELIYDSCTVSETNCHAASAYHFIRIPFDSESKEITVVLSSPYKSYSGYMNQIYIGSKAANIFFIMEENKVRFAIGLFIFIMGILLISIFVFIKGSKSKFEMIYLGAFFACAGYWVAAESTLMQFILPYPALLTNSSVFAMSLLPVFSSLYYYTSLNHVPKKFGKIVIGITFTSYLTILLGALINHALPVQIVPYYLVFASIYTFTVFGFIAFESAKAHRFFSLPVVGMFAFGICGLIELCFYFCDTKGYHQTPSIAVGLIVFCFCMVIDSSKNFTRLYQNAVKVETLSVLAYTDCLTGMKNRTAFFEDLSKIDLNGGEKITLAMFDINNLKLVNDTKGHLIGDSMLWQSSRAIQKSLRPQDYVYRIGGDEFASIILHDESFDLELFRKKIKELLFYENKKNSDYTISIAYGCATYSKETDKTLFITLSRADENMYICKNRQKKSPSPSAH